MATKDLGEPRESARVHERRNNSRAWLASLSPQTQKAQPKLRFLSISLSSVYQIHYSHCDTNPNFIFPIESSPSREIALHTPLTTFLPNAPPRAPTPQNFPFPEIQRELFIFILPAPHFGNIRVALPIHVVIPGGNGSFANTRMKGHPVGMYQFAVCMQNPCTHLFFPHSSIPIEHAALVTLVTGLVRIAVGY